MDNTNFKAHTFCCKDEEGNWIEIPVLYQTVYACYLEHCRLHNIPTVTMDEFYSTFRLLADTDYLISKLIDKMSDLTLEQLGITWGPDAPTADTPGTIYFKI